MKHNKYIMVKKLAIYSVVNDTDHTKGAGQFWQMESALRFYYFCIFVLGSSICLDFPLNPCEPWPLSGVRWCYVQVKIMMLCLKELQFLIIRGLMVSDSSSSPPFRDNIISFARKACLFDNSFTAWKWGCGLLLCMSICRLLLNQKQTWAVDKWIQAI